MLYYKVFEDNITPIIGLKSVTMEAGAAMFRSRLLQDLDKLNQVVWPKLPLFHSVTTQHLQRFKPMPTELRVPHLIIALPNVA